MEEEDPPQEEIKVDIPAAPEGAAAQKVLNISVTNGGAVLATLEYTCPQDDMEVADLKSDLEARLTKIDEERKLRMLIFRGQILQNGKKITDYKLDHGDTIQLLTWVPEAAAAAAVHAAAAAAVPSQDENNARLVLSRADFGFDEHRPFQFPPGQTLQQAIHQEEVERWSARVKVWTCMLMLVDSFQMLVGMSSSLEQQQRRQHSSSLAFSFLGFWVAYIGLRAATRLNFSLARGYYYGQMTVAMCKLFLMATKDPSVTPADAHGVPRSPNYIYVEFALHSAFWLYIVYGAYRFQRALWQWLQDGAPDYIIESQEDV